MLYGRLQCLATSRFCVLGFWSIWYLTTSTLVRAVHSALVGNDDWENPSLYLGSTGSDYNDGTSSSTPKRSVAAAMLALRLRSWSGVATLHITTPSFSLGHAPELVLKTGGPRSGHSVVFKGAAHVVHTDQVHCVLQANCQASFLTVSLTRGGLLPGELVGHIITFMRTQNSAFIDTNTTNCITLVGTCLGVRAGDSLTVSRPRCRLRWHRPLSISAHGCSVRFQDLQLRCDASLPLTLSCYGGTTMIERCWVLVDTPHSFIIRGDYTIGQCQTGHMVAGAMLHFVTPGVYLSQSDGGTLNVTGHIYNSLITAQTESGDSRGASRGASQRPGPDASSNAARAASSSDASTPRNLSKPSKPSEQGSFTTPASPTSPVCRAFRTFPASAATSETPASPVTASQFIIVSPPQLTVVNSMFLSCGLMGSRGTNLKLSYVKFQAIPSGNAIQLLTSHAVLFHVCIDSAVAAIICLNSVVRSQNLSISNCNSAIVLRDGSHMVNRVCSDSIHGSNITGVVLRGGSHYAGQTTLRASGQHVTMGAKGAVTFNSIRHGAAGTRNDYTHADSQCCSFTLLNETF